MSKRQEDFDALVSLRGFFALCIILFHIADQFERVAENFLGYIYEWGGHFGNCYFFTLSGFLMTYSYRNKISTKEINIKQFVWKRFIRLYPLYVITNIFQLLYLCNRDGFMFYFRPKDIIEIFLMICSGWVSDIYPWNTPGWFLSVLMLCYLIYYFVAKLYHKYNDFYYLAVLIFIFAGYIEATRYLAVPFCYNHVGVGVFPFFIGVLLYDIKKKITTFSRSLILILECIGCGGLLLLVIASYKNGFSNIVQEIHAVMTIFIVPTLLFLSLHMNFLKKVLTFKPFFYWGKISFSACMWHIPVSYFYNSLINHSIQLQNLNMKLQFVLYWGILIIISAISYFLIEIKLYRKLCNFHFFDEANV